MITRALAACAAVLAVAAAFFLVIHPEAMSPPATGIAATIAADTRAARSARPTDTWTAAQMTVEKSPPKSTTRPTPYLVQTKVTKKRGKSYLVVNISSRTGTDATLVIRQRICRDPKTPVRVLMDAAEATGSLASVKPSEPARCTTPSTTVRVNARWTISTRKYLGKGHFRRSGAPTWSIKKPKDPKPTPTVTVTAPPPSAIPPQAPDPANAVTTITVTATATVTATMTVTATPPAPTATITVTATPTPTNPPTTTTPPTTTNPLCDAPANPYDLHYCQEGARVTTPPNDICEYFVCIPNFPEGNGYLVVCNDGQISKSGGIQGACSQHGGVRAEIHQGR